MRGPKTKFEFPNLHIIDLSCNGFSIDLPTKYFCNWNAMKLLGIDRVKKINIRTAKYYLGILFSLPYNHNKQSSGRHWTSSLALMISLATYLVEEFQNLYENSRPFNCSTYLTTI